MKINIHQQYQSSVLFEKYLSQFCVVIGPPKVDTVGACSFSETYGIPHKRNRSIQMKMMTLVVYCRLFFDYIFQLLSILE